MIPINPESTPEALASVVRDLAGAGFAATYVFAVGMPEPERVVDVIAETARLVS